MESNRGFAAGHPLRMPALGPEEQTAWRRLGETLRNQGSEVADAALARVQQDASGRTSWKEEDERLNALQSQARRFVAVLSAHIEAMRERLFATDVPPPRDRSWEWPVLYSWALIDEMEARDTGDRLWPEPRGLAATKALTAAAFQAYTEAQNATASRVARCMALLASWSDPELGGHLERCKQYALVLSRELLSSRQSEHGERGLVEATSVGALLHDIGKLAVPREVLHQPEPLEPWQHDVIRAHPLLGAFLIRQVREVLGETPGASLLWAAEQVCLYHHERWDGRGYPEGRAGCDIPEPARIVAVADAFDALTSDRPYHRPVAPAQASQLILSMAESSFDPAVVEAFRRQRETLEAMATGANLERTGRS